MSLSELIDAVAGAYHGPDGWPAIDALAEFTGYSRTDLCVAIADHPLYEIDFRGAVAAVAVNGPRTGPRSD